MQRRSLNLFILASSLIWVVSCGKLEARIVKSSGVLAYSSEKEEPLYQDAQEVLDSTTEVSEIENVEVDTDSDNPQGPKGGSSPDTENLAGPGTLKPTIYYFASLNEDEKPCPENTKKVLHGAAGKALLNVCPKTEAVCGEQGSCRIIQKGKARTFNIIGRFNGQDRYFEIEKDGCRFGYGVRSSCLDPFYTLAADLRIYKPGDVIYVPAVVGLELPDGSSHDGFFVIRDKGRGIVGRGRFDFFTGYFHWMDPKNPFNKLGLADSGTNIPYYRVHGQTAKTVLANRSYPQLPKVLE